MFLPADRLEMIFHVKIKIPLLSLKDIKYQKLIFLTPLQPQIHKLFMRLKSTSQA